MEPGIHTGTAVPLVSVFMIHFLIRAVLVIAVLSVVLILIVMILILILLIPVI